MLFFLKTGYRLKTGKLFKKDRLEEPCIEFRTFLNGGKADGAIAAEAITDDFALDGDAAGRSAIILHSGGTTGSPKDILLTNGNFNALALQAKQLLKDFRKGDKVLAVMPIFHGFGLGVSVHCMHFLCGETVLVPKFEAGKCHTLLRRYRPNVVIGVPTLFEAILGNPGFGNSDLSFIRCVICGGDSLTDSLRSRVNAFLKEHGSSAVIEQGYGLSEAVAATSYAKKELGAPSSIGIPLLGNYYKIVQEGTGKEMPPDCDGEICIHGPTVMKGYLNQPEETARVLRRHEDGRLWLHTGDVGCMNEDGIVTFKQRYKRMIVSSGYNVYPQNVEEVINSHDCVLKSCVVGVSHPYRMQVPKAFVVLKDGIKPDARIEREMEELCRKNLPRFSVPDSFIFKDTFPTTLVGKIDYRALQSEAEVPGTAEPAARK